MIYNCSNCDYESIYKKNVERHINRKLNTVCSEAIIISKKYKITCDICGELYEHGKNMTKHKKSSRCLIKKNELLEKQNKKQEQKQKQNQNQNQKQNITINNNNNNNITNINVIINNYSDNVKISDEDIMYYVKSCSMMVPRFVETIYIKERKCIYVGDINRKSAYLYDNDQWNYYNYDDLINIIVPSTEHIIFEKYDQINPMILDDNEKINYNIASKMKKKYEKEYDSIRDNTVTKELLNILYNNRNTIPK